MFGEKSAQAFLLPLYYVKKQTRTKLLTEKSLVFIIILTSLFSLFIIFKNLPTNSTDTESDGIHRAFIPRLYNNSVMFIHDNNHIHRVDGPKPKPQSNIHIEDDRIDEPINKEIPQPPPSPPAPPEKNEDADADASETRKRREFIKSMTLHAWNGYKKYAWGKNELKPVSKMGHSAGIFGGQGSPDLGATIVDAMDTLYLMGFDKEFAAGEEWIIDHLNLNVNTEFSAFEVNIRFIGGLISLHSLTGKKVFLDKAEEIAKLFLPIFDSPSGIPYSLFNPKSNSKHNYQWASGSCSILAEFGTMSLEFHYLSDITGNEIYRQKIDKIFKVLSTIEKDGFYYNYVNPSSGQWCNKEATLGALADSFYEYLLKLWIYGKKKDDKLLAMYLKAMDTARKNLIGKSVGGLTFAGEYQNGNLVYKMGHLACFSAGMFALTAMEVNTLSEKERSTYKNLAIEITNTCHESYIRTPTHIGPETFHFDTGNEAVAKSENEKYYILRPEVVEAYFYLWRLTRDKKYRDWAWDAAQAIEKHCKTESGYSGIKNVYENQARKDDVQQSFFFAETLKYLFLIFSDDEQLPFDRFVLNTEAHPFLI